MKTIKYEEYIKRKENLNNLKAKGFEFIPKKNKLKVALGVGLLAVAIFPNGLGFLCYPMGFMLLGIKKKDLLIYIENAKFKLKEVLRCY